MSPTKISRTYSVASSNSLIKFAVAGVLKGGNHGLCDESNFKFELIDQSGNIVSCWRYSMTPGNNNSSSNMSFSTSSTEAWSNWQVHTVDLSQHINTTITVEISCGDCQHGDHFGTIFFDAEFPYIRLQLAFVKVITLDWQLLSRH